MDVTRRGVNNFLTLITRFAASVTHQYLWRYISTFTSDVVYRSAERKRKRRRGREGKGEGKDRDNNHPAGLVASERRKGFLSIGTIARIIFSITVVGGTIALSASLSAHFRRGGYDLKGSKRPFKDCTNFCDPLYTPYRPPSMLGRPPWPSASFPSVKALAGFVKRRRHNVFSYIQYVHTHRLHIQGWYPRKRETFLNDRAPTIGATMKN